MSECVVIEELRVSGQLRTLSIVQARMESRMAVILT